MSRSMRARALSSATKKESAVASSSPAATARITATCTSFVEPLCCFFAAFQASGADSFSAMYTRLTSSPTSAGSASAASDQRALIRQRDERAGAREGGHSGGGVAAGVALDRRAAPLNRVPGALDEEEPRQDVAAFFIESGDALEGRARRADEERLAVRGDGREGGVDGVAERQLVGRRRGVDGPRRGRRRRRGARALLRRSFRRRGGASAGPSARPAPAAARAVPRRGVVPFGRRASSARRARLLRGARARPVEVAAGVAERLRGVRLAEALELGHEDVARPRRLRVHVRRRRRWWRGQRRRCGRRGRRCRGERVGRGLDVATVSGERRLGGAFGEAHGHELFLRLHVLPDVHELRGIAVVHVIIPTARAVVRAVRTARSRALW